MIRAVRGRVDRRGALSRAARGLCLAAVAVALQASAVHADEYVTHGTIAIPADAESTVSSETRHGPDVAERLAACSYAVGGAQGQGVTGWVIPVTGGNQFTLYPLWPDRVYVRFYARLPCDAPTSQPIPWSAWTIPPGATLAIITSSSQIAVNDPYVPPPRCGRPEANLVLWTACTALGLIADAPGAVLRNRDTAQVTPGTAAEFTFTETPA